MASTRKSLALACTLALLAAPGAARGQKRPARASVGVFAVAEGNVDVRVRSLVLRGMNRALKGNPQLNVKNIDRALAEFGGEVPTAEIAEAEEALEQAAAMLETRQAKEAAKLLEATETRIEGLLAHMQKSDLARAQFLLGVALARSGDERGALDVFERLQVWRPHFVLDAERYPELIPLWEQAKKRAERRPRGSLEVLSEPEDALAYVDGDFIGLTPTSAEGLIVGEHYVTLILEGHQRRVVKVKVDAKYQELVTETLERLEKYLLVEQSLDRARRSLGDEEAPVSILDLRSFLFIDQAVILQISAAGPRSVKVNAYLYDLRSKHRLSQVISTRLETGSARHVARALDEVAENLYLDVPYDGTLPPAFLAKQEEEKERERPITKKWWFWAGAAVVAAAIATPFLLSSDDGGPPCPSSHVCGDVLLR